MTQHPTIIKRMPRPEEVARMNTHELRDAFLLANLMQHGKLHLQFTDLDRFVIGGAMPKMGEPLTLLNDKETGRDFFLEKRELGAINTGGLGSVTVDGKRYSVEPEGCIYISMGSKDVSFASDDPKHPAKFFILSCPAHASYPTTVATPNEATLRALGSQSTANNRVIRQYIHENGIKSCQLVMGFTELLEGSVWNTFPPHTHNRRTEVYYYFNLDERVLAHFMGEPTATRHLFMHNEEAILCPSWSIHCGCGQGNYKFIWGMAGDNQRFDDMDAVNLKEIR